MHEIRRFGGLFEMLAAAILFMRGRSIPTAVAVALGAGLVGGVFNGVIVSLEGIPPFVTTLAPLTIFSGLAFATSDGRTIFGRDILTALGDLAHGGPEIASVDAVRGSPGSRSGCCACQPSPLPIRCLHGSGRHACQRLDVGPHDALAAVLRERDRATFPGRAIDFEA